MSVRTYGRRSDKRSPLIDITSSSQENSQDFYNFSSQESTSLCSRQDPFAFGSENDPFDDFHSQFNGNGKRQKDIKKVGRIVDGERLKKKKKKVCDSGSYLIELGEMMENIDEVNFALDGLRKTQSLRTRRASLLSLLSICSSTQQRRVLRSHGMAKTIVDAILRINFDDSSCNLAASSLLYALNTDCQDDHLLDSPSCIRFLIKCLKPITSVAIKDKARNIGSKLLALLSQDASEMSDSSSSAIASKVQDILISCKEMKSNRGVDSGVRRPELHPKWIALLTMEKGCFSKMSFEDTTDTVRKTGGNFKEILREFGGLDAIFEVALKCHSEIEVSAPIHGFKNNSDLRSLSLLSKCLKIMENATFLSKDNQNHLLEMEEDLDFNGSRMTFIQLVMSVIKILSGQYLLKRSTFSSDSKCNCCSNGNKHVSELALIAPRKGARNECILISSSQECSSDNKPNCGTNGSNRTSELALVAPHKVASNEPILISSSPECSSVDLASSERSFDMSWDSTRSSTSRLVNCLCRADPTTFDDSCSQELRFCPAMSTSSTDSFMSSRNGILAISNGPTKASSRFGLDNIDNGLRDSRSSHLVQTHDPFAFDGDDFEPLKWDLLYGKQNNFEAQRREPKHIRRKDGCEYPLTMMKPNSRETCLHGSRKFHHAREVPCLSADEEEISSLQDDCLLTAVKVLMNLTNNNPVGCQKIAVCGGLETMASLIASHFPLFSSSESSFREIKQDNASSILYDQNDKHLTDQELDLLVAILGLLVNLVEKDGHNRSRLAAATVSYRNIGWLEEEDCSVIPILCSIFIGNREAGDSVVEGNECTWNDEEAVRQGEKEAEKMIVEAYSALLLAFLSTESKYTRYAITKCLPNHNLGVLVPELERFVAFHLTLNVMSPETHQAVSEVIESCRVP
ncbi:wings apart-like protein 2 [Rutidosis leptorrhynchoides]|uniref:wings apart-like protein 2 n=1 Tax=Rutidosis leptorrhynchoides TaxID=125765 RepID=UPI003A9A1EEB